MISVKFVRSKIKKMKLMRHSRTSKFIIFFVILSIFTFTGLAMWVQLRTGIELSPTLITCFYAFCTGELWMLASIKKAKIKNHYDLDEDGIPDHEDDYVDPVYIKEVEDALAKLKSQMNDRNEG